MQSRNGVRPVNTEARVGEHTVPDECESCIKIDPGRLAHSAMRGVFAVPLFQLKSAHPISSPRIIRNDGREECSATAAAKTPANIANITILTRLNNQGTLNVCGAGGVVAEEVEIRRC